jgi:hypothetical protein
MVIWQNILTTIELFLALKKSRIQLDLSSSSYETRIKTEVDLLRVAVQQFEKHCSIIFLLFLSSRTTTLWHSEDRASWYILIMKANETHYLSNLFDKVLYIFRTSPLSIIRSISTLCTRNRYLSCQFCWLSDSEFRMGFYPDLASSQQT